LHDNEIKFRFSTDEEDNYVDHTTGEIVVSSNQSVEHIIYTMLHELGHYFSDGHFGTQTKITIIIEEVLAWDRGYDIAQTLQIEIDDASWSSFMEACLRRYIEE
jgi:hypothetical protein